jgi:hypothetical protein
MNKEGKLIQKTDPTEAIRQHEQTANWEFREEAKFWYSICQEMDKRFFNGLLYPDGKKVPPPVIAFEDLRNRTTVAQYDLFPDEYGIIGKITFNTVHYIDKVTDDNKLIKVWERGQYSQGETLLHEYIHLWQQIGRGKDPYRWEKHRRETHNKEWHQKAKELGLHTDGPAGIHVMPASPHSPIGILLNEFGLSAPIEAFEKLADIKQNWADWLIYDRKGEEKPKGRSTLHKWMCPDCGLAVRIGINSDPHLVHDVCSEIKGKKVFLVKHDGLKHTIYESKGEGEKPTQDTPPIIDEINSSLAKPLPENSYVPTVESIAHKIGVNEEILYEWIQNDKEFAEALERLKKAQENDPCKTGTDEDTYVGAMLVTFLLLETRNRHYDSRN